MKEFSLNKSDKIWIYGYSRIGKNIYKILQNSGYCVCGYLDRRALEFANERVVQPDRKYGDCDVVIISLQSVISQMDVADELWKKGCQKIIFAAADRKYDLQKARKVRYVYERLLNGDILSEGVLIPMYEDMLVKESMDEPWIIRRYKAYLTIWCPAELLYTPAESMIDAKTYQRTQALGIKHWELDAPLLAALNDPNDMGIIIQYAILHKGDPIQHMENVSKLFERDMWKHEMRIVSLWEWEYSRGLDYFIDAPPRCVWNGKGYFNIFDGCHRSVFLLLKDMAFLPISVSHDDYGKFLDWSKEEFSAGAGYLPAVTHYEKWWDNRNYPRILGGLLRYIYDHRLQVNTIIDAMGGNGYYSKEIAKWKGCKVTFAMDGNGQIREKNCDLLLLDMGMLHKASVLKLKEIHCLTLFIKVADEEWKKERDFFNDEWNCQSVIFQCYEYDTPYCYIMMQKNADCSVESDH